LSSPKWSWTGSKAGTINIYDVWYDLGEGKLYIDVECIKAADAVYGGLNGAEFALYDESLSRGILLDGVGLGRTTWSKSVSAGDLDYYYWLVVIANLYEWGTLLNVIQIKTSEIRRVSVAPNIKITAITPSKTTVAVGETISVTVTFRNDGTADGYATWALSFAGAEYGRFTTPSPVPKNGGTLTQTVSFTIPPIAGTQQLCADVVGQS
jgi:hypothetical protein